MFRLNKEQEKKLKEWILRYLANGDRVSLNKMKRITGFRSKRALLKILRDIPEIEVGEKIFIKSEEVENVKRRFIKKGEIRKQEDFPQTAEQSHINIQLMKAFQKGEKNE